MTRAGADQPDRFIITFASKGWCDATVTVEDAGGKVVRRLASGVLGPNAPQPFQPNSLSQKLVWDGKDDRGQVIDRPEGCVVRVGLGLAPRFEKPLDYSPYRHVGRNGPVIAAAPEGVYVYEGDIVDSIRLFDHEGKFLRTVYPFPADKLEQVKGLRWRKAAQDGLSVPFLEGFYQATFFDSGLNSGCDRATGFGVTHFPTIGKYWAEDAPDFPAATALAVRDGHIALAGPLGVDRMATDGSTGGMELSGPRQDFEAAEVQLYGQRTQLRLSPRSAALSPEGRWLYLTGYRWGDEHEYGYGGRRWMHGVIRVPFAGADSAARPGVFAGSGKPGEAPGGGPDDLSSPVAVACDARGNVYVADYGNNRVQVFSPEGKLVESVRARRPADISVDPRTGDLYVFSWLMKWDSPESNWSSKERVEATLTRLGPAVEGGQRRQLATCPLPFNDYQPTYRQYFELGGIQYRAVLDPWADRPTVWLVPGVVCQPANAGQRDVSWQRGAIKVAVLDRSGLTVCKDFAAEARKSLARDAVAGNHGQYLSVNPATGKLYVLAGRVAADEVIEIDPDSGRERLVELPHTADEIAFDLDGMIYLRTPTMITRYDPENWREVPWDYGEQRKGVGGHHGRSADVIGGLVLPGAPPCEPSSTHCGGFGVSPRGHVAVQCWNGQAFSAGADRREMSGIAELGKRYTPRLYPGRQRWGEIHVWDQHGKLLHEDAAPGVTITDGVGIDRNDNLYVMALPARTPGGKDLFNPKTETLMKLRPGKCRVITSGAATPAGPEGVRIPVPLGEGSPPAGPTDIAGAHQAAAWVQGADWMFGGVGFASRGDTCWNARAALDLYARSYAPEPDRFSVAVLDSAGNVIVRVGRYGNPEDGRPLSADPHAPAARMMGGDEVALMHACYVGVDGGRRLFIFDAGNSRIVSVRLSYKVTGAATLPPK
ncbi:MAG: hypothetical protein BIFFINMI_03519 [Phycisphaerae bacterium]|nr:hypothetical protein [Phycisphaerae bacterium]